MPPVKFSVANETTVEDKGAKGRFMLLFQFAAFWPVWYWYIQRMADSSDEPWGMLALITVIVICFLNKQKEELPSSNDKLLIPIIILAWYIILYGFLPPLLRALLAFAAIGYSLAMSYYSVFRRPGIWGLLFLSLPLFSSLTFYASYPLRRLAGILTVLFIHMIGTPITIDGVMLRLGNDLIWIDAPCSGIRMLWASFYFLFILATMIKIKYKATLVATLIVLPVVILGNALRSASLFLLDINHVSDAWLHEGIGIISFMISVLAIYFIVKFIGKKTNEII